MDEPIICAECGITSKKNLACWGFHHTEDGRILCVECFMVEAIYQKWIEQIGGTQGEKSVDANDGNGHADRMLCNRGKQLGLRKRNNRSVRGNWASRGHDYTGKARPRISSHRARRH